MPNFANESRYCHRHRHRRLSQLMLWKFCLNSLLLLTTRIVQIQMVAEAAATVNIIPITTTTTAATITTTTSAAAATKSIATTANTSTFINGRITSGDTSTTTTTSTITNNLIGFSAVEKEVVEQLTKQWAPIVWLAPEEKFMPLGVEEFLNHVHPADKSKTIIPGMPIGDKSMKAYLVTNTDIEELLENENSFLYGRNPSETPVPIYAVVNLCGTVVAPTAPLTFSTSEPINEYDEELGIGQQVLPPVQKLQTLQNTRGPYIPVSINPFDERNNTIRRSSRLYPGFIRIKRDFSTRYITSSAEMLPSPSMPQSTLNLAIGETAADNALPSQQPQTSPPPSPQTILTTPTTTTDINPTISHVNNFIANLADNVKFSGVDDEIDNSIVTDSESAESQQNKLSDKQILPSFHVTYWMFYPYSQGKTMCTLSLGPLGSIPFPAVYGFCLGSRKDIGSHIGDWEHMSLFFNGAPEPASMYVSAHDAGAYYMYNQLTGSFEFKKQETRKGILQRPNFPKTVTTFNNHPVLFAAKGSHGLWTAPGKHRFVKVARLYDVNGFGTPWNTWKAVDITYENLKSYGRSLIPDWLSFKGKWGNPKSKCHPFRRIGLNFCEYTDGPTGIPLKEPHFHCDVTK